MHTRHKPADVRQIFESLTKEVDRVATIIGASWLEYSLEVLIEKSLRQPNGKGEKHLLFNEGGIFGTFSKKIDGAYFINLIGPATRKTCHTIRKIRNEFAHNMNILDFGTREIVDLCDNLKLVEVLIADGIIHTDKNLDRRGKEREMSKIRFVTAVSILTMQCLLKGGDEELSRDAMNVRANPGTDGAVKLLDKEYISL